MAAQPLTFSNDESPIKILVLDAGGIYGLASAILVRKMCEANSNFLKDNDVELFAGSSSGGVNALLLAAEKNPRDAAISGRMERFFKQPNMFINNVFPYSWWSLPSPMGLGMTGWTGVTEFQALLDQVFGRTRTIGELDHKILIPSFNLTDSRGWRPKMFVNFVGREGLEEPDLGQTLNDVVYYTASPPGVRAIKDGLIDGGTFTPSPIVNAIASVVDCLDCDDLQCKCLRDVVRLHSRLFARCERILIAQAPQWQRLHAAGERLFEKLLEVCDENTDPHMDAALIEAARVALASVDTKLKLYGWLKESFVPLLESDIECLEGLPMAQGVNGFTEKLDEIKATLQQVKDALGGTIDPASADVYRIFYYMRSTFDLMQWCIRKLLPSTGEILNRIRLLSVGVCSSTPVYSKRNFDYSIDQYTQYPTNMQTGYIYPPQVYFLLDAPTEEFCYIAQQMLPQRFHRMDPPLFSPQNQALPTSMANLFARFDMWREYTLSRITALTETAEAKNAVEQALAFVDNGWQDTDHVV